MNSVGIVSISGGGIETVSTGGGPILGCEGPATAWEELNWLIVGEGASAEFLERCPVMVSHILCSPRGLAGVAWWDCEDDDAWPC
jgi:hypothetical protein